MFKRILVPVDFTAGSDRALRLAAALALAHHARVLPLQAVIHRLQATRKQLLSPRR